MICVNLNEYAETMTGNEKWLRKVIAHELAHIFHFKAVWSDFGLLNYAIAEPLPRVWTEGLAQYQTEYWDSQRGDRWQIGRASCREREEMSVVTAQGTDIEEMDQGKQYNRPQV